MTMQKRRTDFIRTPVAATMTLVVLLTNYLAGLSASPRYAESLWRTVRKAQAYGLVDTCQLNPDKVNRFLGSLTLSPTTRHNIRRELMTLWRHAYETGETEVFPARVKKISARIKPPQAWSPQDLSDLVRKAENDQAWVSNRVRLRRCDVLPAWIALGYESGLRLTDMLALRTSDVRNGCVTVQANKTGKAAIKRLSQGTVNKVAALAKFSPDGTLFSWAMPRRRAIVMWRAFLDANGYAGSSKWLRRSGATQLERLHPGMATRWLDHSNPALAKKHYIDATLLDLPPAPPPIG